jgi:hypothetical protein
MPFRVIRSLGRGEKCSGKWVGQAVAILEVKHCDDSRIAVCFEVKVKFDLEERSN